MAMAASAEQRCNCLLHSVPPVSASISSMWRCSLRAASWLSHQIPANSRDHDRKPIALDRAEPRRHALAPRQAACHHHRHARV